MPEEEYKVPVYVVTGFLESGKTSFLDFTIQNDYFQIDEPTLLIVGEQGEIEYDEKELLKCNTLMTVIEDKEGFTFEKLKYLDRKYHPSRVLIEFNPFWDIRELENMKMPDGWGIIQEIVMVDASTFQLYMQNMKSIFVEMVRNADMITFNRAADDLPLATFRRSVKVVNPACEIYFEDENRELTDIFEDSVPYDMDADIVEIADEDYGIFYVDAGENKERYEGKTVRFKGRVLKSKNDDADFFVPGRKAMTCCADDVAFIGYLCKSNNAPTLKTGTWVTVTAQIHYQNVKLYGGEGPVFYAKKLEMAEPPVSELVYFN